VRSSDFLDGIVTDLRRDLPPEWQGFHLQRRVQMLKLWYGEPRLHYEVWPVAGRDLVEIGLHFEADAATNLALLRWFDPHVVRFKAALGGAVDLEQWTSSWGHLYHVLPAPTLDTGLQARISRWLTRLIPLAEPELQAALRQIGTPAAAAARPSRDWAAWRERRARRRHVAV
jgi:hypothetical protein